MSCKNNSHVNDKCNCNFNIKTYGVSDLNRVTILGSDRTSLNWSEISVPEILCIPTQKPDIENLDQVYVQTKLTSVKLIETPFAYTQYPVFATTAQITELTNIQTLIAALDITPVSTALTALLSAINTFFLGVIPAPIAAAITVVNEALAAVIAALTALQTAGTDLTALIALGTDLLTSVLCSVLNSIVVLVDALIAAVNALLVAVKALFALLPQALQITAQLLFNALVLAINTFLTAVTAVLTAITDLLDGLVTAYIEIIPNKEGTCLTGRKLVIEGVLKQKLVYTANVETQSVHSAHFEIPFSAFVIPYANFEGLTYLPDTTVTLPDGTTAVKNVFAYYGCTGDIQIVPNLCEEFSVDAYIEDIFAYELDERTVFKNVTLFLLAKVAKLC